MMVHLVKAVMDWLLNSRRRDEGWKGKKSVKRRECWLERDKTV